MKNKIKLLLNSKGITLIEMLIAMVVMIVIMTAVTSIFAPMLQTYQRANNLAEVNTLLDNISALIMDDVASATEFPADPAAPTTIPAGLTHLFRIRTTFFIDYYLDDEGLIWRNIPGWNEGEDEPIELLPRHYYRFWGDETMFHFEDAADITLANVNGVVTLNLNITNREDGWTRDRLYTARPIGLVP